MKTINLNQYGIKQPQVFRNLSPSNAYEMAIKLENGEIASNGALLISSGEKTGRSPKDKRLVEEETSRDNIWWGDVNVPISEDGFELNKDIAEVHWDLFYQRKSKIDLSIKVQILDTALKKFPNTNNKIILRTYVLPKLGTYLDSLLYGIKYFSESGNKVSKNQFGYNSMFSSR